MQNVIHNRGLTPLLLAAALLLAGCEEAADAGVASEGLERYARVPASDAFWETWSDGQAELSAYKLTTSRYGELREGSTVLIYVAEEADRRTWIKNDRGDVPASEREVVMKLNHATRFRTGIYPYAVMTSVFSPVGGIGRERFAPTRITLTAQEWCGQVYHRIMPGRESFFSEMRSYFSTDGEHDDLVDTAPYALYEDALLIQLRELDGPFAEGGDWEGDLVPTLWSVRKSHQPLTSVPATITRTEAERDGAPVTRFVLAYEGATRTFDVERAVPRRVLAWTSADGEQAVLIDTTRLPYWQLNAEGDERYLEQMGLTP